MVFSPMYYGSSDKFGLGGLPGFPSDKEPKSDEPQKNLEKKTKKSYKGVLGFYLAIFLYNVASTIPVVGESWIYEPVRESMKASLKSTYPTEYHKIIESYQGPVDFAQFKKHLDSKLLEK